jgi:hypothetical protein
MNWLWRLAALALGVYLTGCEGQGPYEYLLKDQGTLNYIVKGGVGIALGTTFLPVYASRALGAGHWGRAILI